MTMRRMPAMILKVAALLAATAAARQTNTSGFATQDFVQKVNHTAAAGSGPGLATFRQRYQLSTQHFRVGGPILFVQAAEAGMTPLNASVFADYAPGLGAAVAVLEHRFFGDVGGGSYPPSYYPLNASGAILAASLTLDNVLCDAVNFVTWIKRTVPGAADSRVIYGGSSYGGFLAVSARMQYHETFYGAIASSPALNSFGPLDTNRYRFDATRWAGDVYDSISADATSKIKSAMLQFKKCIQSRTEAPTAITKHVTGTLITRGGVDNNCDQALPDLNVCKNSTGLGYHRLYNAAANTYLAVAKFNYPWVDKYPTTYPLNNLINQTLAARTASQVLRVPLLAASWAANASACIDGLNPNISRASRNRVESAQPAWAFLNCGLYAVNDVSVGDANKLLPEAQTRGAADLCAEAGWRAADYGRANEYFLQKYALTSDLLDATDRLLVVQGGYDRTAAVGSPVLSVTPMLNHSRVILVDGAAHAEDAVSEAVEPRGQKPQLDQIRDIKLEHIREWLGYGNQTDSVAANVVPLRHMACSLLFTLLILT
ncbi:hypothetical protein GGR52DRAFT_584809 [Hypoxylon sp. FL1284]|nr:hypothetical protein GGR52DRAFT_584809 [Hypoxylon sp. FL1284]